MEPQMIEKAANDFMNDFCYDHIDSSAINREEDNYEAGRNHALLDYGNDIFIAGAEWRINSVWHSTDELPQHSGYLAVLMENGFMEVIHYTAGIGFQEMTLKGYTSWAYVSDLIPKRKEE